MARSPPLRSRYPRPMLRLGASKAKLASSLRVVTSTGVKRLASSTSEGAQNYDVVIIGGGPVGLALASALSEFQTERSIYLLSVYVDASESIRSTQTVALIEASDLSKVKGWSMPQSAFSNRVSSITNASYEVLSSPCYFTCIKFSYSNEPQNPKLGNMWTRAVLIPSQPCR